MVWPELSVTRVRTLSHLRVSKWTCHKVLFPSVVLVFSKLFTVFYYFALYLIKKYLSMFSWLAEIFSKLYKIHIHEIFLILAICLCQDQSITQQDNYVHDGTEGSCWRTCLSVCLFPLSEFEIILLNKIQKLTFGNVMAGWGRR